MGALEEIEGVEIGELAGKVKVESEETLEGTLEVEVAEPKEEESEGGQEGWAEVKGRAVDVCKLTLRGKEWRKRSLRVFSCF